MSDNGLQEYSNRWNKPLRPGCEQQPVTLERRSAREIIGEVLECNLGGRYGGTTTDILYALKDAGYEMGL